MILKRAQSGRRRSRASRGRIVRGLAALLLSCLVSPAWGSSRCDPGRLTGTPGETYVLDFEHDGIARSARVHLPPLYDGRSAVPLWLHFHGYTGSALQSEQSFTGLSALADRKGFVVVFPQSTSFVAESGLRVTSWNDLACGQSTGPAGPTCAEDADAYPCPPECGECGPCAWCTCHDDVGSVATLLNALEETLCVDDRAVFASGFSNGGMFVQRLGCALSNRFAAVAPMAGTLARGFSCVPSEPTSLLLISGRADRTVPLDGSKSSDGYFYTPNVDVAGDWADAQSCEPEWELKHVTQDGGLRCVERRSCAAGRTVTDCAWNGAHVWPKATTAFGDELLWRFFDANRLSP